MNYKAGDHPVVREDLEVGKIYGGCNFNDGMKTQRGNTLTIISATPSGNYLAKNSDYFWTDEMFSGLAEGLKTEKSSNKTSIVAGEMVVIESYEPLRCSECGAYLGRRGRIDGHEYDDTAGWKYCPFCGREIAE